MSGEVSFERFSGSGVCDVCHKEIGSGEAYLVPNDTFYASKKYRERMARSGLLLGQSVDDFIAVTKSMDQTTHSAVCPNCIYMFKEMSAIQEVTEEKAAAVRPPDVPTRSRFWMWSFGVLTAVLVAIAVFGIILRMQANQRVSTFKAEAKAVVDEVGPAIASSITGLDPSRAEHPPRELHDLMKELNRIKHFTYVVLYLPNTSAEHLLWRYQGKNWYFSYEEDTQQVHSWAGFQEILISSALERAMREALSGDTAALGEFNRQSRESWQSVIAGMKGQPLAVLRLTIYGIGGDERKIE